MNIWKYFILSVVTSIVVSMMLLVITAIALFYLPGRYLVVDDEKLQKTDVIIVFSDGIERRNKAIELWKNGYAPYIIFTGYKGAAAEMANYAISKGVSKDCIILEEKAASTYQNMLFSKDIMEKRGWKKAILVSSDYHMRRIKLLSSMLCDNSYSFFYVGAKSDRCIFDREHWWSTNGSIDTVMLEYKKYFGTIAGYAR